MLDTGRPLLEFAPLLAELLAPYPDVEIVLTTSWASRLPDERVISYLPPELRPRVVGPTRSTKPWRSYVHDGTERMHVITSYAYGRPLRDVLYHPPRFFAINALMSFSLTLPVLSRITFRVVFGPKPGMGFGKFLFIVLPCFKSIAPSLSRWRPSSPGCFMVALLVVLNMRTALQHLQP
ncbi:hypothetical protein P350_10765 [Burkholderia cepacia JBK9]|nr:hypothetical protein P350_10765 [Burkholderia cepacia JBK9]